MTNNQVINEVSEILKSALTNRPELADAITTHKGADSFFVRARKRKSAPSKRVSLAQTKNLIRQQFYKKSAK
jgi:hypothetical protein